VFQTPKHSWLVRVLVRECHAIYVVIEKFTKNTRFCLVCNYVSKIIPALQSRCTRFRFSPLPPNTLRTMLDRVVDNERCVQVTQEDEEARVRESARVESRDS